MKEKEEIKLLRCPFCGDMAYTDLLEEEHADDSISEYPAVICQNCGATVLGETIKEASEAWNKRIKFSNTMPTVEEEDGTIRPMWLEEMAEQLKAGDDNGT